MREATHVAGASPQFVISAFPPFRFPISRSHLVLVFPFLIVFVYAVGIKASKKESTIGAAGSIRGQSSVANVAGDTAPDARGR